MGEGPRQRSGLGTSKRDPQCKGFSNVLAFVV